MSIVQGDMRDIGSLFDPHEFDALAANPPYWKCGAGRINPNSNIAGARHELSVNMEQLIKACCYLVKNRGKINLIYTAQRLAELFKMMQQYNIEPKQLQFIHADEKSEASLFCLMASPNGQTGLKALAPKWAA